jgi:hypothetical protein
MFILKKKIFLSRISWPILIKFGTYYPWVNGIQGIQMGQAFFKGEIITKIGCGHLNFFITNHWTRKAPIYMKGSQHMVDGPYPSGASRGKTIFMHQRPKRILFLSCRPFCTIQSLCHPPKTLTLAITVEWYYSTRDLILHECSFWQDLSLGTKMFDLVTLVFDLPIENFNLV